MVQLWRSFDYAVPVFFVACVLVAGIAVAVGLRRRRLAGGACPPGALWALVLDGLLVLWIVGLGLVTLEPGTAGVGGRSVELVPLRGMLHMLQGSVGWQVPVAQIGGNVALFVPGGLLLALRLRWGLGRSVVAGLAVAAVIETLQYSLALGRVASIDDVLLGGLGTLVGAVMVNGRGGLPDTLGAVDRNGRKLGQEHVELVVDDAPETGAGATSGSTHARQIAAPRRSSSPTLNSTNGR